MSIAAESEQQATQNASAVLQWVATQNLGSPAELTLPPAFRDTSQDGRVQVAVLPDSRICLLLKTNLGYKGNFDGVVVCDVPLHPTEISRSGVPSREYITLPGQGIFEELYIRRRINDRTFVVYFDLN